ncbi:hypothetical protein PoB_004082300 [Plakobranchus ocellatus]|uniref:Uncharacterized protein n=1 Tax=Plakobranchus ocellatus TaxID=259542 RepID=A0AAV4B416_9GAST|nr:hypothetical protein PoB_004082300 [Plakobranchus ocellatus]
MSAHSEFEKDLSNTIYAKTGEHICINLPSENVVEVRAISRKGSMPLGIFWVHVFQHPNNYPVYSYPYKKLYHGKKDYELQLRVDGVNVTINLASGQLFIKGFHVVDWFVQRIPVLLQAYEKPPGQCGPRAIEPLFTSEDIAVLTAEREKRYKQYLEQWPPLSLDSSGKDVMAAGKANLFHEPTNPDSYLDGQDLETFNPNADLLMGEETLEQLTRLECGRSIPGVVLYRLWRSTLSLWFSDSQSKVYLVTPYIDTGRMIDVCELFLKHQLTACLDTLVVPLSNIQGKFAVVRKEAIQRFPVQEQVLLEYKILGKVVFPVVDILNSFLAVVKDGKAHVLHSNAEFSASNFLTTAVTAVSYSHLDEELFLKNYLDPILV